MPSVFSFSNAQEQIINGRRTFARAEMHFDSANRTWTCDEEAGADQQLSKHYSTGTYTWTPDDKLQLKIESHRADKDNDDIGPDQQDDAVGRTIELEPATLRSGRVLSIFNKQPLQGDDRFLEERSGSGRAALESAPHENRAGGW